MPREFFGSSSHYIGCGSAANLDDIGGSPGSKTILSWAYPTGLGGANFGAFGAKGTSTTGWQLFMNHNSSQGTTASIGFTIGGSTRGQAIGVANTFTPLNKWWFVAGTYTPSDGGPRMWLGDKDRPLYEPTYQSSGLDLRRDVISYGSDAAQNLTIGNVATAGAQGFSGALALFAVFDNLLTPDQLEMIRRFPVTRRSVFPLDMMNAFRAADGTFITCKGLWTMDSQGFAIDYSGNGNPGTVVGTKLSEASFLFPNESPVHLVTTPPSATQFARRRVGSTLARTGTRQLQEM